jgi:hypothetical protein
MINRENWRNRSLLFVGAAVSGFIGLNQWTRGRSQYTTWYGQPSSVHLLFAVAAILILAAIFFPDRKFDPKSLHRRPHFPRLSAFVKRLRRPIE